MGFTGFSATQSLTRAIMASYQLLHAYVSCLAPSIGCHGPLHAPLVLRMHAPLQLESIVYDLTLASAASAGGGFVPKSGLGAVEEPPPSAAFGGAGAGGGADGDAFGDDGDDGGIEGGAGHYEFDSAAEAEDGGGASRGRGGRGGVRGGGGGRGKRGRFGP